MDVPKTPKCDVGCQCDKIDVRNELCNIWQMSFDKIEVMMHMPQI